jgi:hypothetical protein
MATAMMKPGEEKQMTQPTFAQAQQMLRGGLAKTMRDVAAGYAIPLAWIHAEAGRPVMPSNGSAFLLDAGQGPFLTTARHVYRGFLAAKAEHSDTVCVVGQTRIALQERLRAQDRAHDVATFDVTAEEVADLKRYRKIPLTGSQQTWPPPPPLVDHGVFFVGFTGQQRTLLPYHGNSVVEVEFGAYTALAVASSVSTTSITMHFEHEPDFDVGERNVMPTQENIGGCSGAPVLTFVEERRVFTWRLGGIVTEAGQGFVKAARADCLNADGTINAHPDPAAYRTDRSPQGTE